MGGQSSGRSYGLLFAGGFIVLVILVVGLYAIKLFFLSPPVSLPDDTFISRLEERKYWDEKQRREIVYWVIATQNTSSDTFYNCRFNIVSKGAQDQYEGFFKNYTLENCHQYSLVKTNYDCRLENAWKKHTQYAPARSLRKFPAGTASELAVSRYYLEDQTRADLSFLTKNSLTDIYSHLITCSTSSGRSVSHTQSL